MNILLIEIIFSKKVLISLFISSIVCFFVLRIVCRLVFKLFFMGDVVLNAEGYLKKKTLIENPTFLKSWNLFCYFEKNHEAFKYFCLSLSTIIILILLLLFFFDSELFIGISIGIITGPIILYLYYLLIEGPGTPFKKS